VGLFRDFDSLHPIKLPIQGAGILPSEMPTVMVIVLGLLAGHGMILIAP